MKLILFILLLLFSKAGKSQSSYSGLLGKYPITLVLYHYSDRVSLAYYTYDKYDSPITINGSLKKGELKLFEIQLHTVGFFQIRYRASGLHTVIPKRIEMILEVKAFQILGNKEPRLEKLVKNGT
jgi:hypothetical protein